MHSRTIVVGACLFLGILTVYVGSLAPGVSWGDSARLALDTREVQYRFDPAGGHPLHAMLGKLFNSINIATIAYRENIGSAVFGALSVVTLFLFLRCIGINFVACLCSSIMFGLSHMFWLLSTLNEHYTLGIFLVSVQVLMLAQWWKTGKRYFLYLGSFLLGLSLCNNLAPAFYVPAYLWAIFAWERRLLKDWKVLSYILASFLLGLIPWVFIYLSIPAQARPPVNLNTLLLQYGWTIDRERFGRSLVEYAAYLFYQFPLFGFIFGIVGLNATLRRKRRLFVFIALAFIVNVIFASTYMRQRSFNIWTFSSLPFAIWIAFGLENILVRYRARERTLVIVLFFVLLIGPVGYFFAPRIAKTLKVPLGTVRILHWRDNYSYYLWPGKRTEYGAYQYAWNVFRDVKPDAVVLADYNPVMPLLYVQRVDGKRQDIQFALRIDEFYRSGDHTGNIMRFLDENYGNRPLYLADDYQPYYRTDVISKKYDIIPEGALFRIREKRL